MSTSRCSRLALALVHSFALLAGVVTGSDAHAQDAASEPEVKPAVAAAKVSVAIVDIKGQAITGATLTIDGKPAAPDQMVELPPGDHAIVARAGSARGTKTITLVAGDQRFESVTIVATGAEASSSSGLAPITPYIVPDAMDGAGGGSAAPGPPMGHRAPLPSEAPAMFTNRAHLTLYGRLGLAGTIAGFVAIGVGTYYALLGVARGDEAGCPNGQCASSATQAIDRSAGHAYVTSAVLLSTGAVLAGGGFALWYSAPRLARVPAPAIDASVVPATSPGGGGLILRGTF